MSTRNTFRCTNDWSLVFDSSESGAFIGPCQEINSFPALLFIGNALPTDDSAGFVLCGTTQIINVSEGQKLYAKCRHGISGSAISLVSDSDDFAAVAGNTGPSTTNGFMRWIRDKWNAIAPSNWLIVGGAAAVGSAPTVNPVGVSGVDLSGLKRSLLTDSTGQVFITEQDSEVFTASASSASVLFTVDMTNWNSLLLQVTNAGSSCTISYETSSDQTTWSATNALLVSAGINNAPIVISSTAASQYQIAKRGKYLRARVSVYGSGTVSVAYSLSISEVVPAVGACVWGSAGEGSTASGNPVAIGVETRTSNKTSVGNGQIVRPIGTADGRMVVRPHSIPENEWNYVAATGGIENTTTAVTIKSGAGVGIRNYITSLQIQSEALATATELAIRESPGGTTIWRIKIPTTGLPLTTIGFADPIRSPANSLLEVVTLTASGTGAVYFNAQGYVAP